ncbi:MAG: hypothetical protein AAB421_02620 [Patescibacteria group bacterium]
MELTIRAVAAIALVVVVLALLVQAIDGRSKCINTTGQPIADCTPTR